MIKKLVILFIAFMPQLVHAWDFSSGDYCYDIISADEVAVAPAIQGVVNEYCGVAIIPEHVYYDGVVYQVSEIADRAFAGSAVTQVQIPNTVLEIGKEAFAGCDRLSSITLPLYITYLPERMLAGTAVKSIVIPEGVEAIGAGAFHECTQLHTVYMPSTMQTIGDGAFEDCFNLFEMYVAAALPPQVIGETNFLALSGVDLIVENNRVLKAYSADPLWGDSNLFSLWTNDEILLDRPALNIEAMEHGISRVELGNTVAFSIYGPDGYLMAVTAADHYYLPTPQVDTEYAIVTTNLITESSDALPCIVTPPAQAPIEADFAHLGQPTIVAQGGSIYVRGDQNGTWTTVCDIYGRIYYQHPTLECFIDGLPQGRVYVVIVGEYVAKVAL